MVGVNPYDFCVKTLKKNTRPKIGKYSDKYYTQIHDVAFTTGIFICSLDRSSLSVNLRNFSYKNKLINFIRYLIS